MQKTILFFIPFLFHFIYSNGQLTNTWNFSTGHNNANGQAITNGQDSEWLITGLTPPNVPPASYTLPYASFPQGTWGAPPTPLNTQWVSFAPTAMLVGVQDSSGGSMTLEYQFETCRFDTFSFDAMVMADNEITELSIDDSITGFVMASSTIPDLFSYEISLPAGIHKIKVTVRNYPYELTNAIGLNIDGVITGRNSAIIDRVHFPNYICSSLSTNDLLNGKNTYISQNAPNPFHDNTTVKYSLPQLAEAAYITITDISGRAVHCYTLNNKKEGTVVIPSTSLNSGLYFYSLIINGIKVATKKMLVEK